MNSKGVSEKAIEYIETCIDSEISLESISNIMNYSKFHFHRLFLSEMGLSVMTYIRMRKILQSTHFLRTRDSNITTIAMDFGFNNVDTFIRNFKSYYGITPSQYRTIMRRSNVLPRKEVTYKMENLYKCIKNCSQDEKKKAIYMLERMVRLSKVAHEKGLLSLEKEVNNDDLLFMKKALELLLKGTEYSELEKILLNYMLTSDLSDYDLMLRILIMKGVLLLHKGAYPWDLRIELSSYFGEDFIDILEENGHYQGAIDQFLDSEVRQINDNKVTKALDQMNQRTLQRVFRECDIIIIGIVLMGQDKDHKEMVINSLALGQKKILLEVVASLNDINGKHIIDANHEIIRVIQALRLSKDIN